MRKANYVKPTSINPPGNKLLGYIKFNIYIFFLVLFNVEKRNRLKEK